MQVVNIILIILLGKLLTGQYIQTNMTIGVQTILRRGVQIKYDSKKIVNRIRLTSSGTIGLLMFVNEV